MPKSQRIVGQMPLAELWDATGPIPATRGRVLSAADIREMLHSGPVSFASATVGEPLRWIPEPEGFDFWKREARPHLVPLENVAAFFLDNFPQGYCYVATEWTRTDGLPVVLLEKFH